MRSEDVEPLVDVCAAALWGGVDESSRAVRSGRIAHLLASDPGGAWVAEHDGRPVGTAMALLREGVWGLSLLALLEEHRTRGAGRAVLAPRWPTARAPAGRSSCPPSTRRDAPVRASGVRPAPVRVAHRPGDHAAGGAGGRARRGAGRLRLDGRGGPDGAGRGLRRRPALVAERRRAPALRARPRLDGEPRPGGDRAAGDRRRDGRRPAARPTSPASSRGERGAAVRLGGHDWAVRTGLAAGLALSADGPIFTRGELGTLAPWIPSGAFL